VEIVQDNLGEPVPEETLGNIGNFKTLKITNSAIKEHLVGNK